MRIAFVITMVSVMASLAMMLDADAGRRTQHVLPAEPRDPNPIVSVRLGVAPPWRVTLTQEGRLNGCALPAGSYDVQWRDGAVRIQTADGRQVREAGAAPQLSADTPVALNGRPYRGSFLFRRYSVLNQLPLQDYLRGVVGREIGMRAEQEALRAQTIVARTYALARITGEVADDTSFQVYAGVTAETEDINRAVDDTAGQILTFRGRIAREVCYHSTCGGRTEDNENVFLTMPVPYLRGVHCTIPEFSGPAPAPTGEEEIEATEQQPPRSEPQGLTEARGLVLAMAGADPAGVLVAGGELPQREASVDSEPEEATPTPSPYPSPSGAVPAQRGENACERSSWYHWTIRWPARSVPDIAIVKTSPSGRVVRVRIGERVVSGDDIRRALRFRDTAGRVRSLYSTAFTLRRDGDVVVVEGRGWGHGVGLCQWGARGMARAGAPFADILSHYYPGTERIVIP